MGASFSALNWQAAALAGLPPRGDRSYAPSARGGSPPIYAVGVDGKPLPLPTARVQFTATGDVLPGGRPGRGGAPAGGGGGIAFAPAPAGWRPWDAVPAAVGDLPVFSQLLGDGKTPFDGPAALIGLDVLSQRRVVLGAGRGQEGRRRRLFVSKR